MLLRSIFVEAIMRFRLGALLALAIVAIAQPADAARRALVIGINEYREVSRLQKAVGDANAVRTALEAVGFQVDAALDADRRTFNAAVAAFVGKIQPGDVAVVHYSGHGVELDNENYLLPADIPKPGKGGRDFLKSEAIRLQELVMRVKSAGARTQIFIVDACRDNPFSTTDGRSVGGSRGLAAPVTPGGTFIFFSAGIGETALDRLGPADGAATSVYTRVLIDRLRTPGRSVADVAQDVREEVNALAKSADHEQNPAYYDQLSSRFFFVEPAAGASPARPPAVSAVTTASPPTPPPASPAGGLSEREAYGFAQQIGTREAYDTFLSQFPSGSLAGFARAARDKIVVAAAPPAVQGGWPTAPAAPAATSPGWITPSAPSGGGGPRLIFPDSSQRYLRYEEIARLSKAEMRIARNEIFARRGRVFDSPDLQTHFGRFSWYNPTTKNPSLNAIEQANAQLILSVEQGR